MAQESSTPTILGISGGGHDAAAALLKGPDLIAAIEEHKLARVRRSGGLPAGAIQYCLQAGRVKPKEIDYIALARPLHGEPGSRASEPWGPKQLKQEYPSSKILVLDHHLCHAAAAYFPSPFEQACVLTLDETGDLKTGSLSLARGNAIEPLEDAYFPDSIGNVFSRATALAGFTAGSDEHKLQWLSAWGNPVYASVFREIFERDADSVLSVDQSYFLGNRNERGGFGEKFFTATGIDPAGPLGEQTQADLAASAQQALEEVVMEIAYRLRARTPETPLVLGGGVALNSLLVEKLETSGMFPDVFVQPAAGNAGNAIGAALYCAHSLLGLTPRMCMEHLYYGPEYAVSEIKDVLENCKLQFRYLQTREEILTAAVSILRQNHILGWFQGRAEFGPRALGARSILGSPLGPYVSDNLNQYVKHRERFRPFAASVTQERSGEFFEYGPTAKFLVSVGRIKPQSEQTFAANLLPGRQQRSGAGVARIRVHVVERSVNPLFWGLLEAFGHATGLPVLFNTSFNLFGEPLVCSPRDAVRSFFCSGIDHLILGNFLLSK